MNSNVRIRRREETKTEKNKECVRVKSSKSMQTIEYLSKLKANAEKVDEEVATNRINVQHNGISIGKLFKRYYQSVVILSQLIIFVFALHAFFEGEMNGNILPQPVHIYELSRTYSSFED